MVVWSLIIVRQSVVYPRDFSFSNSFNNINTRPYILQPHLISYYLFLVAYSRILLHTEIL